MHQTKFYLIILLILFGLFGCIEPFQLPISNQASRKYIVSGQLTDQEGYQYVTVSLASRIDNPQYIPLNDCIITILDDEDNSYPLEEYEEGKYRVWMGAEYLKQGTSYQLNILTPAGVEIVSDFDEMPSCPEVDSIYYKKEDILTNDPDKPLQGIQFYIDVDVSDTENNYYRWKIEETWEYHTVYPIEWYYDGQFHQVYPPDYSRNVCWSTTEIENIYTLTVENIGDNTYTGLPLHFVDNHTSRLAYGYSILVKQFALNEAAYVYWDQMRLNSSSEASLYEKQPISIKGNLNSPTNPEVQILGFFGVTSMKSKRIFVKNVPDLEMDYSKFCPAPAELDKLGWGSYGKEDYPIYFLLEKGVPGILIWQCVDCLVLGGINVKPDFWPDDN